MRGCYRAVLFKHEGREAPPDPECFETNKFQVAASIVFHAAIDPAVVTYPPVVLTSEMVPVYANASPPLDDVNRQLLNFIEVYEQNGSGWVVSNFVCLQLT